jgi:hypothetical protein
MLIQYIGKRRDIVMNYQDVQKAREYYDIIANICETIDEKDLCEKPKGCTITLKDILQSDVAQFIMYLTASDGHISFEEVQAYKAITGYGGDTIDSIKDYIKENNIYSMDFESEPPLIMKILSKAERNAIMYGAKFEESILNIVVSLFEMIGQIIISIDGGITYNEKRDYNIILSTIRGYAQEHSIVGDRWSLLGD